MLLDDAPRIPGAIAETEAIVKDRWGARVVWSPRGASETGRPTIAEVLGRPFPAVIPGDPRPPLHRPAPVVVVAPIGIAPEVLDEAAAVSSAMAEAGLDVRVRVPVGLRPAVRRRVGRLSSRILWAASTDGGAAAELAVATDVVIIGSPVGIDFARLVDDARVWSVRAHVRPPADPLTETDEAGLAETRRAEFVLQNRRRPMAARTSRPGSPPKQTFARGISRWPHSTDVRGPAHFAGAELRWRSAASIRADSTEATRRRCIASTSVSTRRTSPRTRLATRVP